MVSLRLKQIVETNTGCSVRTLGFSGRISNTNKQAVTCCKKANWVKVSTQAELGSIDLKHTKICTTNERKLCQTNQICKTFPMLVQNDHNCTALHPVKWPSLTLHNKTFCFGHLTQQRIIYSWRRRKLRHKMWRNGRTRVSICAHCSRLSDRLWLLSCHPPTASNHKDNGDQLWFYLVFFCTSNTPPFCYTGDKAD